MAGEQCATEHDDDDDDADDDDDDDGSGADSMGHGGKGGHVPPLLQMAGHGVTVSRRTANKKLTKLY